MEARRDSMEGGEVWVRRRWMTFSDVGLLEEMDEKRRPDMERECTIRML